MSDDHSTTVESEWLAPPDQPADDAGVEPATAGAPSRRVRWLRAGALMVAGLALGGGVALSANSGSAASGGHHDPGTAPAAVGSDLVPPDDGRFAPDADDTDEAEYRYSSWRTVASAPGKNSPS